MPVYEYWCQGCDKVISLTKSMFDESIPKCPQCGWDQLKRRYSSVSVIQSETERVRDVSWIDKDLARRLKKKSKGKLSPQFRDTLDRMESN